MTETVLPRVLSIFLNQQPYFNSQYGSLITTIKENSIFQCAKDKVSAIRFLSEEPRPSTVLVTDEAITLSNNASVWDAVLKYICQGGTAVLMGHFSAFLKPPSVKLFFAKAGVSWEHGSYHRTTLILNRQVVGNALAAILPSSYSQKAVFLKNVAPMDSWYVTDENSVTESRVFASVGAQIPGECPVVFACIGNGRLGYIGDVNGEEGSEAAVLGMCDLV